MKMRGVFGAMNKRLKHPEYEAGLVRQATGDVIPENGACALMAMALEATAARRKERRSLDDAVRWL